MKIGLPNTLWGKNIMFVAHPDDETLFAYSQLSQNKNWLVVCATGNYYPERSIEFTNAMNRLGVKSINLNHKDEWQGSFDMDRLSWDISNILLEGFDNVLTHNSIGEYGHTQHSALYSIVERLVTRNLYVFKKGSFILPFNILKGKIDILSNIYTSQSKLNAYDWYEQNNYENNFMNFVISEDYERIK